MENWKDNIHFVLVEPRESGNIGACARAMKNMGFGNLCLVNPRCEINEEAKWFARNALDVLESVTIFNNLNEAVRDKSLTVGTTRRVGKRRGVIVPAEVGAKRVYGVARENKVAVVFGREDRGLYNHEVDECGILLTIPASKEQPSLNLSHAVVIVAYELARSEFRGEESRSGREDAGYGQDSEEARRRTQEVRNQEPGGRRQKTGARKQDTEMEGAPFVSHEELAILFGRMSTLLNLLGYIPKGDRDLEREIMRSLKRFIARAGLTEWELKMLHGICSQIEKKLSCQRLDLNWTKEV